MRKLLVLAFMILFFATTAQTSMSFYHFGDLSTFQNSGINPAHTPDARFFFGLPVISGVHAHYNIKFSYNQLIRKEGADNIVNVNSVISDLQKNNLLSTHANVAIFIWGIVCQMALSSLYLLTSEWNLIFSIQNH